MSSDADGEVKNDAYGVVLVYSVSHAVRIEKILQGMDISCKLIPVPRHLSSDCGVCVRILRRDRQKVLDGLEFVPQAVEGYHNIA